MTQRPPQTLRARILAESRALPSPTVAEQRKRSMLAGFLAACATLALSYRLGLPASRSSSVLVAVALGGGLSALAATWVAASRGGSMLGRSRAILAGVTILAPLALVAWATFVTSFEGGIVLTGGTIAQHASCIGFTLLFALGPFAAFAYVRRGTDPVHPRALGAALGAAAGAWGGTMIDLHCKVTTVEHFALGHALPIVILAALGAAIGVRAFGVRARS
ncbi:MAG: NrsF family protein [Polyangiaceae bacterium]